jgi:hypothetical protein
VLGDGVQHLQTTTAGDIWVGYSDEGVFGNYGWGAWSDAEPIGAAGLVRFDRHGARLWSYTPPTGVDTIDDCYAMNVTNVATWAYYYSDFPLVLVTPGEVRAWTSELEGAGAFAVDGAHVLFTGGYGASATRVVFARLGARTIEQRIPCRLRLPGGRPVPRGAVHVGRGPIMHVFAEKAWHQAHVGAVHRSA